MQINRINNVFKLVLLMATLAGCSSTTPQLDRTLGDAVNDAKAQQTLNPDASKNNDLVQGMGGKAAKAVVTRYYKTYQAPPVSGNVFTIGVGSGGGSGAASSGGAMQ